MPLVPWAVVLHLLLHLLLGLLLMLPYRRRSTHGITDAAVLHVPEASTTRFYVVVVPVFVPCMAGGWPTGEESDG